MKIVKQLSGIIAAAGLFAACSSEPEPSTIQDISKKYDGMISAPFHYQKAIEVKPGLTFDVMTWGRGADSVKAYLILVSDSLKKKFTPTSGELKGNIHEVWNMDMDSDGNPEIFIQSRAKSADLNLYVHEFDGSGSSQKLRFPDLTEATKKKYRGHDTLYIKEDKLIREFPLYKEGDADNKPSEGRKYVGYGLSGNEFTVQNLNAKLEPEQVQAPPPEKKKVVKKATKKRKRR